MEPLHGAGEVYKAQKRDVELVITGGHAAKEFHALEKVFERLFQGVQQPDMEEVMVDWTCCRAHQCSAGARKSSGAQAIGITRGGLNTKIPAVCDALGNPLRFVLTAAQRHDSRPVAELLDGLQAKALLADKAQDSEKLSRLHKVKAWRSSSPAGSTAKRTRAFWIRTATRRATWWKWPFLHQYA